MAEKYTGPSLLGPEPVYLPKDHVDQVAKSKIPDATSLEQVAELFPASSLIWGLLARQVLEKGNTVTAFAYARTGYHRGLDSLRRAGWRGVGLIPADHEPNQGFLIALAALAVASQRIGENDEAKRCEDFLQNSGTTLRDVSAIEPVK